MNRPQLSLSLLLALLGAFTSPTHAQVGSVLRSQLIKPGTGGFVGPLDTYEYFGQSLAALGDLNGDGVGDLAVGSPNDSDGGSGRGAIWILFLKPDGSVLSEQKISQTQGGFGGALADHSQLGRTLACVGDLDGDGLPELAAACNVPNRMWILFLNANGSVKSQREDLFTDPVFAPATQVGDFYFGPLVALGDLDGDGLGDLAIGAPHDSDGAFEAGALWIARLSADGSIHATQKISQTQGGFTGTLEAEGYFGIAMAQLGDLDGDGNRELAVLSPYGPPYGGTLWVLYLDANEHVLSQRAFGRGSDYELRMPNGTSEYPSWHMAWLGDIDGDGVGELATGWPYANFPGGTNADGGITISSPRADAHVPKKLRISNHIGGLGDLPRNSEFGQALAALGDLDGDGSPELAVGAPNERANGIPGGGVWILSLSPTNVRNGSGANPLALSEVSEPVFGSNWTATLDCSGHASGLAILWGYDRPGAGIASGVGEILLAGNRLFQRQLVHAGGPTSFTIAVPPFDTSLLDLPLFVQGLCTGAPAARLSNALDVLVGR